MTILRGAQNETADFGRIIVKGPAEAFRSPENIDASWRSLNYLSAPELDTATAEHYAFTALLESLGAEPIHLPADDGTGLDSLYVRDAAVVCERGALLCSMGKTERSGEPAALAGTLEELGVPILGDVEPPAKLEGGDVLWLDEQTLLVGQGYRTNAAGIDRLGEVFEGSFRDLIVVPLPHWKGPQDVFHLMSMISPVSERQCLVHSPLLPVSFRDFLLERGFELVDVAPGEFDTLGCNVLAAGSGRCIMAAGNPRTRQRLEDAGLTVFEYEGGHISVPGEGGPTCLTRPLERKAAC